jgi:C1A family cysteine protease
MTDEEKIKQLEEENTKLREKLVDFKQLEEELLSDKVFKKAKDKLVSWYTIGGIAIFVISIIGVKSMVDYSKELVSKKLETFSEEKINEIFVGESHKQVAALLQKQQDTLTKQFVALYDDAKMRLDLSKNGYGNVDIFDTTKAAPTIRTSDISRFDLSSQMNPVRDQGNEGSTVGFTVASALEFAILQKDNLKTTISPRYIYNSINHKNDGGAMFTDAFNFLSKTGAIEESGWAYRAGEYSLDPPTSAINARHFKITNYKPVKVDLATFKNLIVNRSCIVAGMTVYSSLYESKNGIYPSPKLSDQLQGGQGVCIVGFDDKTELIKFRNSWGKSWGDNGYGYIKYGDISKLITDAYIILL